MKKGETRREMRRGGKGGRGRGNWKQMMKGEERLDENVGAMKTEVGLNDGTREEKRDIKPWTNKYPKEV